MKTRNKLRDIMDLVRQYGDERSCVTYNGWFREKSPDDLLDEIERLLVNLLPFDPQPGDWVKINGNGDLMIDRSLGKYIGETAVVVKRCKSGLYQVNTGEGLISLAKRNLEPVYNLRGL